MVAATSVLPLWISGICFTNTLAITQLCGLYWFLFTQIFGYYTETIS